MMRFQLTATPKTNHLALKKVESITIVFEAPTWDAAGEWATGFLGNIANPAAFSTTITYAPGRPVAADENIGSEVA